MIVFWCMVLYILARFRASSVINRPGVKPMILKSNELIAES
jgi:hypothetical protein